jgi:hypothetical protein
MAEEKRPAVGAGLEVRIAWRRGDAAIEADATAFWERIGVLPEGVDPAQRAKELIAAAYKDGELIAVATATLELVDFLGVRMAVLRGATDPAHRRGHAQLALAVPSHDALRDWALAHPEEKLAGAVAFVAPGEWGDFTRMPVWPESELEVVGYTADNQQIRARWFDHFRFD